MDINLFCQLIVNGLSIGLLYVLVIVGLGLIIDYTRILNFAHGEFYMLGAYTVYFTFIGLHLSFGFGLVLAFLSSALLGGVCYLLVFRRLRGNLLMSVCASFGLSMLLTQLALFVFGRGGKTIPPLFSQLITIGNVIISLERVVLIATCSAVMLALHLFIWETKLGKAMRAVCLDSEAASLYGIDTNKIFLLVFVMGCALAGFAGGIVSSILAISVDMGGGIIFIALNVLIAGGVGSMVGGILGGVIVGLLLSFGYQFFGGYSELILFIFVFILLIFKPMGILGKIIHIE